MAYWFGQDSSAILDDRYNGKNISPERLAQILCLFKMEANVVSVKKLENLFI